MTIRVYTEEDLTESLTKDDLLTLSRDDNFLRVNTRSTRVTRIRPLEITGNIFKIRVGSATEQDKWYVVSMRVLDKWNRQTAESYRSALMTGRIGIKCTCPSDKYWGYAYLLSAAEARVYRREWRYPIIRNPALLGSVCKHARAVLEQIESWRFSTE